MAQRKEARVFVTIWNDETFRAHKSGPQRLYLYLLSQADLSYCGVIALRERRWARDASDLTVDQIDAHIEALTEPFPEGFGEGFEEGPGKPLVVVDEDTGELLVRSLIRHDGIWKQPNLLKAARESAEVVQSPRIRLELIEELRRLPVEESPSTQVKTLVAEFIADLEKGLPKGFRNPPGKGSANPSAKGSGNPDSGGDARKPQGRDSGANDSPGGYEEPSDDAGGGQSGTGDEPAGQDPHGNPSAKGSGNPSAKGLLGDRGTSTTCTTVSPIPCDPSAPRNISSEIAPRSPDALSDRADVERLCKHLADRIEGNGCKRPTITKKWRDAARLMLDRDGRAEADVHAAIDWCQDHGFWRANVMSMPKLRDQYDRLSLQARERDAGVVTYLDRRQQATNTIFDAAMERARERDAQENHR